jgi:hypothetical protein
MRVMSAASAHRRQFATQIAHHAFQPSYAQGLLGIGCGQRLYGIIDKGEPYFQFRKSLFEVAHDHSGREILRPRPIP